jgi:hypothetical protein
LAFYLPPMRAIFHFSTMHLSDISIAVLAGFLGVLWFEVFKLLAKPSGGRRAESES